MKARLLPPATQELLSAIRWYNAQRAGLGAEFRNEAKQAIKRIEDYPLAWQPLGGEIRRCQLNRFPYGAIYAIDEDAAIIVAIAHLHREPDYWRKRL